MPFQAFQLTPEQLAQLGIAGQTDAPAQPSIDSRFVPIELTPEQQQALGGSFTSALGRSVTQRFKESGLFIKELFTGPSEESLETVRAGRENVARATAPRGWLEQQVLGGLTSAATLPLSVAGQATLGRVGGFGAGFALAGAPAYFDRRLAGDSTAKALSDAFVQGAVEGAGDLFTLIPLFRRNRTVAQRGLEFLKRSVLTEIGEEQAQNLSSKLHEIDWNRANWRDQVAQKLLEWGKEAPALARDTVVQTLVAAGVGGAVMAPAVGGPSSFSASTAVEPAPFSASAALDPTKAKMASIIAQRRAPNITEWTKANGGATWDIRGNKPVKEGFAVGAHPDRTEIISGREVTQDDVRRYIERNYDLLTKQNKYVSTWVDPQSGATYLDVATVLDRKGAVELARRNGELAIFDIGAGREIRLDQADVWSAQKALPQNAPGPIWFSPLERGIESVRAPKAPAGNWKNIVRKLPGVKQDEIDAVGLDEWLDFKEWLSGGAVTKGEVLEFVRQNGVQVEEVLRGAPNVGKALQDWIRMNELRPPNTPDEWVKLSTRLEGMAQQWQRNGDDVRADSFFRMANEAGAAAERVNPETGLTTGITRYDQWQLPGGQNYRELLLTLPAKFDNANAVANKLYGVSNYEALTETQQREVLTELDRDRIKFRGDHFDEPNVLAHVRFNERTDADGKRVLFVEEIQSDWAQKGRRDGFSEQRWKLVHDGRMQRGDLTREQAEQLAAEVEADTGIRMTIEQDNRPNLSRIPKAPFVTNTKAWAMLAMKRMIRYAAEQGFDRIAWTTGEQQAERYDLSKYIHQVIAGRGNDGKFRIQAYAKDSGLPIFQGVSRAAIAPEDLPNYVGKEMADKIIKETPPVGEGERVWSGLDLKVGGEGMRSFYDRMLPQWTNKYVRKWGVQVGQTQLTYTQSPSTTGLGFRVAKVHALDITPQMRAEVLRGQPLFAPQKPADFERGAQELAAKLKALQPGQQEQPRFEPLPQAARQRLGRSSLSQASFIDPSGQGLGPDPFGRGVHYVMLEEALAAASPTGAQGLGPEGLAGGLARYGLIRVRRDVAKFSAPPTQAQIRALSERFEGRLEAFLGYSPPGGSTRTARVRDLSPLGLRRAIDGLVRGEARWASGRPSLMPASVFPNEEAREMHNWSKGLETMVWIGNTHTPIRHQPDPDFVSQFGGKFSVGSKFVDPRLSFTQKWTLALAFKPFANPARANLAMAIFNDALLSGVPAVALHKLSAVVELAPNIGLAGWNWNDGILGISSEVLDAIEKYPGVYRSEAYIRKSIVHELGHATDTIRVGTPEYRSQKSPLFALGPENIEIKEVLVPPYPRSAVFDKPVKAGVVRVRIDNSLGPVMREIVERWQRAFDMAPEDWVMLQTLRRAHYGTQGNLPEADIKKLAELIDRVGRDPISSYFNYPLLDLTAGHPRNVDWRYIKTEVFAQLFGLYYSNPDLVRSELPLAYQWMEHIDEQLRRSTSLSSLNARLSRAFRAWRPTEESARRLAVGQLRIGFDEPTRGSPAVEYPHPRVGGAVRGRAGP